MKLHPYADDYFNHRLRHRKQVRRSRERKRLRQQQKRKRDIQRLLQTDHFPPKTRRVDTLRICPAATYWYQAYILNPKLENPRFHKIFRNRFRMPYGSYKELISKIADKSHRWSFHFDRWLKCNALGKKPSPISLLLWGHYDI